MIQAKARLLAKTSPPLTRESSGTYVCVLPDDESRGFLSHIANSLRVHADPYELHSTLMYAKGCFPKNASYSRRATFGARIKGIEYWDGHDNDGYLVVILDSPGLVNRHRYWTEHGLKHSFDDYTPHVTLATRIEKTPELMERVGKVATRVNGRLIHLTNETIEGLKPKKVWPDNLSA